MNCVRMGVQMVLAMALLFAAGTSSYASPILYSANGHYYEAVAGSYDWEEARDLAYDSSYMGLRGHLAVLTTQDENDWVWNNLDMPQRYLLGARDRNAEGVWEWVTGESWSYTNWAPGEPNNGDGYYEEDSLSFDNVETTGTWNDLPYVDNLWGDDDFQYILGYIVEYEFSQIEEGSEFDSLNEHAPVPEPATLTLLSLGLLGAGFMKRKFKR